MHVRFERSDAAMEAATDDIVVSYLTVGPYEWVQATYGELRTAPDGDVLAYYYGNDRGDGGPDGWRLRAEHLDVRLGANEHELRNWFSDFVVY